MPIPNYGYYNPYMSYPAFGYSPGNPPVTAVQPQAQPAPQPAPQPHTVPPQEPLVNGGLVVVPSEDDVIRYPVAPGNTVTFKIENQPVIMEKSMGRSQFASPSYERYKLVREETSAEEIKTPEKGEIGAQAAGYATEIELDEIRQSIDKVHRRIDKLKSVISKTQEQIAEARRKTGAKLAQNEDVEDDEL